MTLAERLKWGMEHAEIENVPKVKKVHLAAACGCSDSAVGQWLDGTTLDLKMANLFAAADYLGLNPRWLGTEKGPKLRQEGSQDELEDDAFHMAGIYATADKSYKRRLDALAHEAWEARRKQLDRLKPPDG